MSLQGKKILITAGPTWVPIDSVRVISNISTGETGRLLAKEVAARGARVNLLLGPCAQHGLNNSISITRFSFFNELKNILSAKLRDNKYDIIIHTAAISDFKPKHKLTGKLISQKVHNLKLVPTQKLVNQIHRFARGTKLVMFKLETSVADRTLIQRAKRAARKVNADLVVANRLKPYRAFIIERGGKQILVKNKQQLAKRYSHAGRTLVT